MEKSSGCPLGELGKALGVLPLGVLPLPKAASRRLEQLRPLCPAQSELAGATTAVSPPAQSPPPAASQE